MHKKFLLSVGVPLLLVVIIGGATFHLMNHGSESLGERDDVARGGYRGDGELNGSRRTFEHAGEVQSADTAESPVSIEDRGGARMAATGTPTAVAPTGKLKVGNFIGTLQSIDTGCYADGECFAVVDGKHITTTMGWSQEVVGTIDGVESFGDLEKHVGEYVEVYAKDNADGTYTLYGSAGFHIKLIGTEMPKPLVN